MRVWKVRGETQNYVLWEGAEAAISHWEHMLSFSGMG